jgi:uncharacterized protein (TIGR01777 family)
VFHSEPRWPLVAGVLYYWGMPAVLITGATGFVGRPLAAKFLEAGWSVTAFTRDPAAARTLLPDSVTLITRAALASAEGPIDAVVHLAGASIAGGPWTRARRDILWRSRVDATRDLVARLAARPAPPRVFVSASGAGFYGHRGDDTVRVTDAPGDDFLGRMAAAWEEAARGAAGFGARTVQVRLGMVLGPGGGALPPLALSTKLGLGAVLGDGRQYWPWIHRSDAVDLFYRAVTDEAMNGPLHGAAGDPVTQRTFARRLAAVLHRPVLFRVPAFALRAGLGGLSDLFLHGQRIEPDARFTFRHATLESALRDSLAVS